MATNKNATIRYQTLDRCFRNPGRKYYIEELVEALSDLDPDSSGIRKRQIYEDIKFMRESRGFDAPIESYKDGRKTYYRYDDLNFSINNQPLNEKEAQQLRESLFTLSRFKGMPQFEWVEEIKARLEQSFHLKSTQRVMSFEENPFLTGREYIGELYNSIVNQQVLKILYRPFKKEENIEFIIHPYHLKQYNNRWFLFGLNDNERNLANIALDRIVSIEETNKEYQENDNINFEEYFEDVIGVTVNLDANLEKVLIKISSVLWPYVKSKPLHGSQKVKMRTDSEVIVELTVQVNHELIALLFSYLDGIEILEPVVLRERVKTISESIFNKYR
ncbi:MAG: WYL domain-containing protein [Bacteroidales bacterium]|nr:WYL domain-containing protein [Bacteroidales bacterium]MCF8457485.1 WYL domain-containing protein [Bacteroidales bacterium]